MIVEQKALRPSHCAPRPRSTEQRLRVRYFCPTRLMADGGREQDERGPELEHGRCLRRPTVSKFPQRTPTHLPEVHRYLHSSSSDWRCGFEAGQLDAGRGVDAGRAPLCSLHDHLGCHRSGRPPTPPWPRTIYCVSTWPLEPISFSTARLPWSGQAARAGAYQQLQEAFGLPNMGCGICASTSSPMDVVPLKSLPHPSSCPTAGYNILP